VPFANITLEKPIGGVGTVRLNCNIHIVDARLGDRHR
jgi:hypothetical protein